MIMERKGEYLEKTVEVTKDVAQNVVGWVSTLWKDG